jgi:hypothetical protein
MDLFELIEGYLSDKIEGLAGLRRGVEKNIYESLKETVFSLRIAEGTTGYATNPDGGKGASVSLLSWSEAALGILPRSRLTAATCGARRYLYPIPLSPQSIDGWGLNEGESG